MADVEVISYTDPACPGSWAAEPVLARLRSEFAAEVSFTYVLGGLAREVTDPHEILLDALDAAARSGMPVDPRGWAGRDGRPPRSTYPACLAVKAAAEQGLDGALLRVLREGFWLRRQALDTPDALEAAAGGVPGLDRAAFGIALRSSAIAEAFGADLERARDVRLPTFAVRPAGGEERRVAAPEDLRDAVIAAGAAPGPLPDAERALQQLGPRTTAELAAVLGLAHTRAAVRLWALAGELAIRPERVGLGDDVLWHAAA